jgi:hypothetical protein
MAGDEVLLFPLLFCGPVIFDPFLFLMRITTTTLTTPQTGTLSEK